MEKMKELQFAFEFDVGSLVNSFEKREMSFDVSPVSYTPPLH
jgi:hypothetical protein